MVNLGIYGSGFCFFGLPPFLPLMRDCSLPASVFGPVEQPPCHLQRPPKWSVVILHGVPARVLAPQGWSHRSSGSGGVFGGGC